MDDKTIKNKNAFLWLYTEVLVRAFNDILTNRWYQYYTIKYLTEKNKTAKRKLKKHFDAINWLLYERYELCFEVLKLIHLKDQTVLDAISKKFNSQGKRRSLQVPSQFPYITLLEKLSKRCYKRFW